MNDALGRPVDECSPPEATSALHPMGNCEPIPISQSSLQMLVAFAKEQSQAPFPQR